MDVIFQLIVFPSSKHTAPIVSATKNNAEAAKPSSPRRTRLKSLNRSNGDKGPGDPSALLARFTCPYIHFLRQ